MATSHTVSNPTGRVVASHPALVKVGRVGWAAKGVVYVVAGILAIIVALEGTGWSTSSADQEASPTGAFKTIAGSSGGAALLWVLAAGMLLYAAWRVVSALMPGDNDAKGWAKRIGFAVSAIMYATFAFTAISLARTTTAAPDGNTTVSSLTERVMTYASGRVLIGILGAIVIGVGLYRMAKGFKQDVADELDLSGMSAARVRVTRRLGSVGEIGRSIGIGLIGFFLLRAAMTFDAAQATGLDGALRRLVVESWGALVVVVVGVGFVAYGTFCLATFTHRVFEAP